MPLLTEHIAQAEKNERLYESLLGTEFNDWAVTGLFYAALHHIDAYFIRQTGARPSNHSSRNRLVDRTLNLSQIRRDYAELYNWSRNVRYDTFSVSTDEALYVRTEHFIPVYSHIRALLGIS